MVRGCTAQGAWCLAAYCILLLGFSPVPSMHKEWMLGSSCDSPVPQLVGFGREATWEATLECCHRLAAPPVPIALSALPLGILQLPLGFIQALLCLVPLGPAWRRSTAESMDDAFQ